ncbi:hypothetical protein [Salibacter sp.]|jgi:hypothetical protein|uniref:hypothetical protein n=1 Tax=Salibacter sp. TaxID=2010995 RepID=UPI00286FEBF1|nr:hypothetical protein [Salibacter sp.]MDR9397992.1 hypothetical protein [Salibacter sp.]MDR9486858.1 hypothetical protein [Salibacter sp.]
MKKVILFTVLIVLALFWSEPNIAQCSMCRAVVENNDSNIGQGLNNGILYLMGFPYIMIMAVGILLFRKFSKDHKQAAA